MRTILHNSSPGIDIIRPSALSQLASVAPDRELLLGLKLSCHHFLHPAQLSGLDSRDIVLDCQGTPIYIHRASIQRDRAADFICIDREHGPVLKALLPQSGPLFHSEDPFGRLQRFAAGIGIRLSRMTVRNSCRLYAFALGLPLDTIAHLAGMRFPNIPRRQLFCPVNRQEAEAYWSVPFDVQRIASLPTHLKRLPALQPPVA